MSFYEGNLLQIKSPKAAPHNEMTTGNTNSAPVGFREPPNNPARPARYPRPVPTHTPSHPQSALSRAPLSRFKQVKSPGVTVSYKQTGWKTNPAPAGFREPPNNPARPAKHPRPVPTHATPHPQSLRSSAPFSRFKQNESPEVSVSNEQTGWNTNQAPAGFREPPNNLARPA